MGATEDTIFARAVDDIFERRAENITYIPEDDFPRVIPGIVTYGENLDGTGGSSPALARAQVELKVSDVSEPSYRDVVIIDAVTWYVQNIEKGDGLTWVVNLTRDKRPGFRR